MLMDKFLHKVQNVIHLSIRIMVLVRLHSLAVAVNTIIPVPSVDLGFFLCKTDNTVSMVSLFHIS